MKGLFYFLKERRDVASSICVASAGGSFIGGLLFNTLGAGDSLENAVIGFCLYVFFIILSILLKGGK
ncbi:MAG: hypothetical protein FWE23_09825 [Chitinivibrionia bacterium]|nr:hypothetical protein [Chitinivibrionia bacterium]